MEKKIENLQESIDKVKINANKFRGNPWAIHNILKDEEAPDIQEVIKILKKIAETRLDYAAALSIIYLSSSRVNEILPCTLKTGDKHPGMLKKDIKLREYEGRDFIIIRTRVEKIRDLWAKRHPESRFKTAYILAEENALEYPILEIIDEYLDRIEGDNEPLFKFQHNTLYKYFFRNHKLNLHILRHWRNHHVGRYYNYTEADLIALNGWMKRSTMPSNYSKSGEKSLMEKAIKFR